MAWFATCDAAHIYFAIGERDCIEAVIPVPTMTSSLYHVGGPSYLNTDGESQLVCVSCARSGEPCEGEESFRATLSVVELRQDCTVL